MSRNFLKYIAIIAMTLDHIACFIPSISPTCFFIFKMIGRITFPIMCFFIAQGIKYTSNKKKYANRLLIFALISQIPWTLLHDNNLFTWNIFLNLNTIFTLLFSYLFISNISSENKIQTKIILSLILIALCFLCDYKFIGILYLLYFYYLPIKEQKLYLPLLLTLTASCSIFLNYSANNILANTSICLGLFLTIPLIYFYDPNKYHKNKFNKYVFYIYYPLHLLVIFFINLAI